MALLLLLLSALMLTPVEDAESWMFISMILVHVAYSALSWSSSSSHIVKLPLATARAA